MPSAAVRDGVRVLGPAVEGSWSRVLAEEDPDGTGVLRGRGGPVAPRLQEGRRGHGHGLEESSESLSTSLHHERSIPLPHRRPAPPPPEQLRGAVGALRREGRRQGPGRRRPLHVEGPADDLGMPCEEPPQQPEIHGPLSSGAAPRSPAATATAWRRLRARQAPPHQNELVPRVRLGEGLKGRILPFQNGRKLDSGLPPLRPLGGALRGLALHGLARVAPKDGG
mmetsp:Transcript_72585/g.224413  ORF Transcript_72585/g.224413 Transcript_72585/m.224413 type:complete len:224 (+) Transcript_72585:711-1382(+)